MDSDNTLVDARRHLLRLTRLVSRFLKVDFNAEGLWLMQLDLLSLQQDVQELISLEKSKLNPRMDSLALSRWTRHNSRRFGDAFAWVLLDSDQRKIFPLAKGSSVPIASRDESTELMVRLAREMFDRGWGFPLLHDVTNCLRLGDITFVNLYYDTLNTVEVKARRTTPIIDSSAEYAVTAHFAAPPTLTDGQLDCSKRTGFRRPARLHGQLKRIKDARQHQIAEYGLSRDSAGPFLTVELPESEGDYFEQLIPLCRRARRRGYADAVLDRFVCYAVHYNADEVSARDLQDSPLSETIRQDLLGDDIESNGGGNGLIVQTIPSPSSEHAPELAAPYMLFSLPKSTILDMLNSRMSIIITVRLDSVFDALKKRGINAQVNPREPGVIAEIVLSTIIEDNEGEYRMEYHGVEHLLLQFITSFRSLDYVVNGLCEAFERIRENAPTITEIVKPEYG